MAAPPGVWDGERFLSSEKSCLITSKKLLNGLPTQTEEDKREREQTRDEPRGQRDGGRTGGRGDGSPCWAGERLGALGDAAGLSRREINDSTA